MTKQQVYVLWDERMMLHKPILLDDADMEDQKHPQFVPERPSRVLAVAQTLESLERTLRLRDMEVEGIEAQSRFLHLECPVADKETICRTHTRTHYERLRRTSELSDDELLSMTQDNDLYYCKDTFLAASLAVGGCIEAVDAVTSDHGPNRAMAIVRPPGHHAERNCAMGFCFFNNCAIAAQHAIATGRASRVLILDWDIHHGNGIQDMTYNDPNIFYLSLHRASEENGFYYPGTGKPQETGGPGTAAGTNLNIAFDSRGMGDTEYAAAFQELVLPAIKSYSPDLVIVACGLDAAKGDLLGDFGLHPEMFHLMTKSVIECVGDEIPIVCALEGGYNISVIAECMKAVTLALLDEPWGSFYHKEEDEETAHMKMKTLSSYWQRDKVTKFDKKMSKAMISIHKSAQALAQSQVAAQQLAVVGYVNRGFVARRPRLSDSDRYPFKRRILLWPDNPHLYA